MKQRQGRSLSLGPPACRTALALVLLASLAPVGARAQSILVDRIVARVNDRMATLTDFEHQLADKRQAVLADAGLTDAERQKELQYAGRATFADIYEELLLLSRADQLNVRISDADVQKAVQQTRERMGLKTDQQFQQALQSSGLTEDMLKERLRKNLLVQEVMGREVQPRLKIDEEELRRYYREHPDDFTEPAAVRLEDVVVLDNGDASWMKTKAEQVRALLQKGTAADAIAKQPELADATQVVDLGWVQKGDLDPELEQAAWALQPGETTVPTQGRGGLHVVRMLERRAAKERNFDDVKAQIQERIEQQHMTSEYRKYLKELEGRSYIALKVPPEAEGFAGLDEGGKESPFGQGLGEVPAPKPAEPAKEAPGSGNPAQVVQPSAKKPAQPAPPPPGR